MLRQIVKSVLCLLVAVLAVSAVGSSASAQSPPMSAWLHMSDRPSNPTLGNYLGNVKPQQDLAKVTAAQAQQIQSQQRALQALQLQGNTGGGGSGGTGSRNLVAGTTPTGGAANMRDVLAPPREIPSVQRNPAGFNKYLHY